DRDVLLRRLLVLARRGGGGGGRGRGGRGRRGGRAGGGLAAGVQQRPLAWQAGGGRGGGFGRARRRDGLGGLGGRSGGGGRRGGGRLGEAEPGTQLALLDADQVVGQLVDAVVLKEQRLRQRPEMPLHLLRHRDDHDRLDAVAAEGDVGP